MSKVIVLGAGGHAKVVIDAIGASAKILGVTEFHSLDTGSQFFGVPVLGDDSIISAISRQEVKLVNGIGSTRVEERRTVIFNRFKNLGYTFFNVVHPSAILGSNLLLGEGVQILAGCVVQADTKIGKNSIINTGAKIDHDCRIGDHVHVAPGVTISGGVTIGSGAHIGVGATIIQGVEIGEKAMVGAGAVVLRSVPAAAVVYGVPAKQR